MPAGGLNLFALEDPKLAQYNNVDSFFGGVAPLVRSYAVAHA